MEIRDLVCLKKKHAPTTKSITAIKRKNRSLLDEIPSQIFQGKEVSFYHGKSKAAFYSPLWPAFFFHPKNSRGPLWRDYWSSAWSPPKKALFVRHPWIPMTLNYRQPSRMDEYTSMGFLSQILPRIKARKEILYFQKTLLSWVELGHGDPVTTGWKIFHFPTSFSSHWFSHALMRNIIWLFGHV